MPRKFFPVPEALFNDAVSIEGIKGTDASMDNQNRVMRVPLANTPGARHIRAHEMSHAKYSPATPKAPVDIAEIAVQRAEDMRMNVLGRKAGLGNTLDAPALDDENLVAKIVAKSELDAVTAMAATYNTGDYQLVKDVAEMVLSNEELTAAEQRISELWDSMDSTDEPSWNDTINAARSLMRDLNEPPPAQGEGEGQEGEGQEDEGQTSAAPGGAGSDGSEGNLPAAADEQNDAEGKGQTGGEQTPDLEQREQENWRPVKLSGDALDKAADKKAEQDLVMMSGDASPEDKLERARIVFYRPPLTKRLSRTKTRQRSSIPTDRGRVPRYMHRYSSDKAMFVDRGKRRIIGGTILIDCSQIMNLTEKDVEDLMEIAPTATIATYCGCWVQDAGKLWVIADKGKRTEGDLIPNMGCFCVNSADLPVLDWICAQDGPRFWLGKDGDGTNSESTPDMLAERARLMKASKVRRFDNIPEMVKSIRKGV